MSDEIIHNGNELLLTFINSLLKIMNKENPIVNFNIEKLKDNFDFDFFNDDISFYTKVLSHFDGEDLTKILDNITKISNIFLRNLYVFLKYLQSLINEFKLLYKDPIIKLDVSLIIGYLVNKYGSNTVESVEFFFICIKELEKKYGKKCMNFSTKYDTEIKLNAQDKIETLLLKQKINYSNLLNKVKQIYIKEGKYNELDDINIIIDNYKNDSTNMPINELETKYYNNENYKKHLDYYLEKKLEINGYDKENYKDGEKLKLYNQKKNQLKNNLFFLNILKIDLNDIDNCIYVLYFMSYIYKVDDPFFDTKEEFNNLLSRIEINFKDDDYTNNLKGIIEDKSFVEDIKQILKCSSVKNYFEKALELSENGKDFEFSNFIPETREIDENNDDFLKDGFNKLLNNLEKDKNYLSKIIVFKYLPKYNRAFVDPNMRIVINPLYFEFSQSLDENKRNNIFRAYLFIIILHEIVHLLKFMKKEKISFDNIPKTPKNKEGGKMFINYLFNLPIIYYITDEQASIINEPKNWDNLKLLSNLFKEQKKWYENREKNKDEYNNRPLCETNNSISFYLSLIEDDINEGKSKEVTDDWYDMD